MEISEEKNDVEENKEKIKEGQKQTNLKKDDLIVYIKEWIKKQMMILLKTY